MLKEKCYITLYVTLIGKLEIHPLFFDIKPQ